MIAAARKGRVEGGRGIFSQICADGQHPPSAASPTVSCTMNAAWRKYSLHGQVGAVVRLEGNLVSNTLHIPLLPGLGVTGEGGLATVGRRDAHVRPLKFSGHQQGTSKGRGACQRGGGARKHVTSPSVNAGDTLRCQSRVDILEK